MNKQIKMIAHLIAIPCSERIEYDGICVDGKECGECHTCTEAANAIYNAGYRKSTDVAKETVEAIKAEARKKEQYVNDLFGYGGYVIATTDLEDIIRRYMFDTYEEAELKKKYESEGEE